MEDFIMRTKILTGMMCLFSLMLFITPAIPQENGGDKDYDKFRISLGWFNPRAETTLRLDASNSDLGTTLRLEDDVGLSKGNGLFRADGFYRFKKRHRVDFGYYDFDRSGTQTISAVINFGDEVFPIDALVNSFFDIEIIKISYTYLIIAKPNMTVGASIGFNISDVTFGLSAETMPIARTAGASIPLPVFGLNGTYHLGSNFWLEAHVQYFYIDLGSIDGSIFDARVAVNYRIKNNFGIGIGYNVFSVRASKENPDFTGRFKLKYDGAQIFASLFF